MRRHDIAARELLYIMVPNAVLFKVLFNKSEVVCGRDGHGRSRTTWADRDLRVPT
jgi:hypothetical protein